MKVFSSLAKSALAVAAANAVISIARADAAPAVPTSAYAQSGSANLLLQLDAIDNAGAGVHEASPATWVNLAGGSIALDKNGANDLAFDDDAWAADGSCYFKTTSDDVKSALTGSAAAFTVELVIESARPGRTIPRHQVGLRGIRGERHEDRLGQAPIHRGCVQWDNGNGLLRRKGAVPFCNRHGNTSRQSADNRRFAHRIESADCRSKGLRGAHDEPHPLGKRADAQFLRRQPAFRPLGRA